MATIQDQNAHIPNAEAIIERFGGIRPMASKVVVPVTTVQGWKKRNVIPANRADQIADAALRHSIDLGKMLDVVISESIPAPASSVSSVKLDHGNETVTPESVITLPKSLSPSTPSPLPHSSAPARYGRRKSDRYANAVWFAVLLLAGAVLVGLLAMGPGVRRIVTQEKRLIDMETQLRLFDDQIVSMKTKNALLEGLVPDDLKTQITGLQERASQIESTVSGIGTQAKAIVNNMMGTGYDSITERLAKVESEIKRFTELTGSTELTAFVVRLQNMQATEEGVRALTMARAQLLGALEAANPVNNADIKKTLDNAVRTNEALRTTMDGLKGDDLKAAAMLMVLTQYRATLTQNKVSFDQDLRIMRDLVGTDSAELLAAIDQLTPQAKAGVETPVVLGRSFKSISGKIIEASLSGKNVSVAERIKARLHDVLKIEHDGKPLTGTPTQQVVGLAQEKLDGGDIPGAINILQALDGAAAEQVAPWVAGAEKTVLALQVQDLFTKILSARISVQPLATQLGSLQAAGYDVQGLTTQLVQSLSRNLASPPYVHNGSGGDTMTTSARPLSRTPVAKP